MSLTGIRSCFKNYCACHSGVARQLANLRTPAYATDPSFGTRY